MVSLMRECWRHDSSARPDFTAITARLEAMVQAQRLLPEEQRCAFPCGVASFANKDEEGVGGGATAGTQTPGGTAT